MSEMAKPAKELFPLVYDELRRLAGAQMANEAKGHTLNATALVHEAYLRLQGNQRFENRRHFFAAAAEAMRRILVDSARSRNRQKRGGNRAKITIAADVHGAELEPNEELLAIDEGLEELANKDPVKAELVKLRYYAGLTADEAAELLGISVATGDRYWAYARAWLVRYMDRK